MASITTPRRSQSGDGHDSLPPLGDPQPHQQHVHEQLGGGRTLVSSTGSVHAWPERPQTARNPNGPPAAHDDEAEDFATDERKVHIAQSVRGRERTYDVNLVTTHMPLYEPLLDEYLADYFNSPKIRQHLQRLGLVDAEGNIVDAKRFKYNQIRLDQEQYQTNILKRMQELDFDREIEQNAPFTLPYPEFLANYPATMTRTALLYAEKPALTKAEEMLVAKLRQQAPRKLKALGLTPELLSGKEQHARSEAKRDRAALWKSGSRQASAGAMRANHAAARAGGAGASKRPTTAAPKSSRNRQGELVVHDDLSGDEWEGLEGHEVTTGKGASRQPKQLHEQDSVTNLFEIAKRQYQSGNIDDAETQVRRILQKVGRPGTGARDEPNVTSKDSVADSTPPTTAPATAATTRPTSAAVAKLRSGRSTPRHRSLRPKSARPTRESHFPIASDFSDFDAGSEGGYESDGEINLSEDQAMDNQGIVNVVVGSEPIAEDEEVVKAVLEQTQVETPSAQDGDQEEKQLGETRPNEQDNLRTDNAVGEQEQEAERNEQSRQAHEQPSHDGYEADFEGTDTSTAQQPPVGRSAPTDDGYEADFDQDQVPDMVAPTSGSNPSVSQKSHSIAKFWDVESVDAVVEQSGPAFPRTTENSSFDVIAGSQNRLSSKPGSKHGSGIVAAVSSAVHKITHRGSKEAIEPSHEHDGDEPTTERHHSSPMLQQERTDENQSKSQSQKQHTSSPLLRDGSRPTVPASGPSAQRLNSPVGSVKNTAKVAVSSPLAKSIIAKSSPSLGGRAASNSATAAAASSANVRSGSRPGTAAQSSANVNRAGASQQVLKSTPNLAAEKGGEHAMTTVSAIDPNNNNVKSTTSVALQKDAAKSTSGLGRRSDSFENAAGQPLPPSVAGSVANIADRKASPRSTANLKSAAPSTNNVALQKDDAKSTSALGRRSDSFENAVRQPLPPSVAASVANVADGRANARSKVNLKSAAQSTNNVAYQDSSQENSAQNASDAVASDDINYAAAQPLPASAFQSTADVSGKVTNARSAADLRGAARQSSSPALPHATSANPIDAAAAVPLPASAAQSVVNVASDTARSINNLRPHPTRSVANLQNDAAKTQLKKSAQSSPNVAATPDSLIDRAAAEPLPDSVAASTANVARSGEKGVSGSVRFASQNELLDRTGAKSSSPSVKKGENSAQSSFNVHADNGKGSDFDRAAAIALPPSGIPSTANIVGSSPPKLTRGAKTPAQSSPNLQDSALDRAAAKALPPSAAPSVANVAATAAARSSADVRGSQNQLAKGSKPAAQSSPNVQRSTTALDRAAAQALPDSVAPSLAFGLNQTFADSGGEHATRRSEAALRSSSPEAQGDNTAKQSSPALNKSRAALQSKSDVNNAGASPVDRVANIPLPASVAPSLATGLDQIHQEGRKSNHALSKAGGKSTPALNGAASQPAHSLVDRAANIALPASVAPSLATGLDKGSERQKSTPALDKSAARSTPALRAAATTAPGSITDRAANTPLPASVAPSLASGLDDSKPQPTTAAAAPSVRDATGTSTMAVGLGARMPSSGSISKLAARSAGTIRDAGALAEMRKVGSVEFAGVAPEDVAGADSVIGAEGQQDANHGREDGTSATPAAKGSNADIWADIRQPIPDENPIRTAKSAALSRTASGNKISDQGTVKRAASNNKLVDPPQLPGKPVEQGKKAGGGSSRSGSKSNLMKETTTNAGVKKMGSRPVSRSQSQRSLNSQGVAPAQVQA
ncbi:hypothetical protein HDU86_000390 [Geranomyces michiganensis]|nr:hypothetical protein HDU86_000390 [Geranomyces michiganensis]